MTDPATNPDDPLFAYILTILTPLLLTNTLAQATRAARQTITAYKAAAQDQLLSIAQIIGLALASLDDLRLSAAPDLSLSMKLKLRGNANALSRSSQRATATLEAQRHDIEASPDQVPPGEAPEEAEILAALAAARFERQQAEPAPQSPPAVHVEQPAQPQPQLTPQAQPALQAQPAVPADPKLQPRALQLQTPTDPSDQYPGDQYPCDQSWANAMTDIAVEFAAELTQLPPAQRQIHLTKIRALTKTALALSQGRVPFRTRLLSTASLLSTLPPQQPKSARNVMS